MTTASDHGAGLRVALVGPTYPFKGGIAAHTTALAHQLQDAGHEVALVSWSHLYPSLLYPGESARIRSGVPDVEPFPRTTRPLSWARPTSWADTGRAVKDADVIMVVHAVPAVIPAHLALIRAARKAGTRATIAGLVHNVLPHESTPADRWLMQRFLGSLDAVLVHSADQAALAEDLGAREVSIAALPPHLPGGDPLPRRAGTGPVRLLALGLVRDYKGLDLVLEALREVPELRLTIAGEFWGSAGERVADLAADPAVADRVDVVRGYVPADDITDLLAEHDVLVLAYRSATGSQNVQLAHHHGLPVLATDVGTFAEQVRDGVDGLLVPAADRAALVTALRRLADRDLVEHLRDGIRPPDLSGPWARYVAAIETIAALSAGEIGSGTSSSIDAEGSDRASRDSGLVPRVVEDSAASLTSAARLVTSLVRRHVDLGQRDLPEWVRPTDVLTARVEADQVVSLARELGLPRARGSIAAWAAMGALSAVLRVRDGDRRSSVIVDPSGPRSVFSRWARAIGYAPVDLDPTDTEIASGSLDVIARLHPGGCTSNDIDGVIGSASRVLRRGGLLTVTVPVGGAEATAAILPADLRALVARADSIGMSLVGDLDRDIAPLLSSMHRRIETDRPGARTAYALVRLTLRRR